MLNIKEVLVIKLINIINIIIDNKNILLLKYNLSGTWLSNIQRTLKINMIDKYLISLVIKIIIPKIIVHKILITGFILWIREGTS